MQSPLRKHGNRWHSESCWSIAEIRPLWEQVLSTRQIAARLGMSKSLVHKLCMAHGLTRDRAEAVHLRNPSISTHWRSARAAARSAMERFLKRKLEPWEHVHHKDEDYTNRTLSNLEVLVNQDHYDLHWPNRKIPYEQRPNRKEYKRIYNAKQTRNLRGVCIT